MTAPAEAAPMREDVTREDRELFIQLMGLAEVWTEAELNRVRDGGRYDDMPKMQLIARHRLAHTARPDAGDEDVERVAKAISKGLIDGLKVVASTKAGQLGSCSTVALHLPLEWEGGDWVVTIETKADHEAAAPAAMREGT